MNKSNTLRVLQQRYWRKTLVLTLFLLFVWFLVTFVSSFFARELNALTFLGLPVGYFIAAHGSILTYLALIMLYAWLMNRLDRDFGVDEQ